MTSRIFPVLLALGAAAGSGEAQAAVGTADLWINGGGVSGHLTLTYSISGTGANPITGISGALSDPSLGITNLAVTGLIPIDPVVPLPDFVTAPDFSYLSVPGGVPSPPAAEPSTSLSYDNTYYPGGSWVVCLDYPFSGGVLDVYGVAFTIANGDAVDLWSNGVVPGATSADYGLIFGVQS